LNQLESVLERTDGARIELAVSHAAFKYRYTVIRPAQVPRDPLFPDVKLLLAAGFLASLLLALAVVVAKDLLSNRILEAWQIERRLGLPVLGTLRTA
jgi:capsular polysaccharide biosynthesis protein